MRSPRAWCIKAELDEETAALLSAALERREEASEAELKPTETVGYVERDPGIALNRSIANATEAGLIHGISLSPAVIARLKCKKCPVLLTFAVLKIRYFEHGKRPAARRKTAGR